MITLQDVKNNKEIEALIKSGQRQLDALGYTEHSERHINIVAQRAGDLLEILGYPKDRIELARIAGYMHDIGNCINRVDHAHSGAILAYEILKEMGMPIEDRTEIMTAIGNHDENTGNAVIDISAAIILAYNKSIALRIVDFPIDTNISPVLDYFEIFMERTMMSKHAAKYLNIWFELIINDTRLL